MKKVFNKINVLIALLIIIGTFLVYGEKWFNQSGLVFSRYFFYLPIVLAGAYYGVGAGIFISSLSAFSFAPLLLLEIDKNGLSYKGIEYILTLTIFFLVGIISSFFYQKNNSVQKSYLSLYKIERIFNDTNGIDEVLNEINSIFLSKTSFFINSHDGLFSVLGKDKKGNIQETKNVRLDKDSLVFQLITNKKDFISTNLLFDSRIQIHHQNSELDFIYLSIVPIIYLNSVSGLLAIETNKKIAKEDLNLLKTIASNLALNFQNKKLYNFAVTDKLTRIFNRRYFDIYLRDQIQRNPEQKLSLLIIDIDFFKKVNDRFGHPKGDEILIRTAGIIKKFSEPYLAFRIGGEEFAVILNNSSSEKTLSIAESIRNICEKNLFYLMPDKRTITISIGISSYPKDAKNTEDLFSKADEALYRAKEGGRNRVEVY